MSENNRMYMDKVLKTETLEFADINKRLASPSMARVLHATLGISSEIGELLEAVVDGDEPRILEELGDAFWYGGTGAHALMFIGAEMSPESVFGQELETTRASSLADTRIASIMPIMTAMIKDAEMLQSNVKAHIYYGRRFRCNAAFTNFFTILDHCKRIGLSYGWSKTDIMEANNKKLLGKETGRYKGGFSADDANHRDLETERAGLEESAERKSAVEFVNSFGEKNN